MDDTPILNEPWPDDLDPANVASRTRSVTILRRMFVNRSGRLRILIAGSSDRSLPNPTPNLHPHSRPRIGALQHVPNKPP